MEAPSLKYIQFDRSFTYFQIVHIKKVNSWVAPPFLYFPFWWELGGGACIRKWWGLVVAFKQTGVPRFILEKLRLCLLGSSPRRDCLEFRLALLVTVLFCFTPPGRRWPE